MPTSCRNWALCPMQTAWAGGTGYVPACNDAVHVEHVQCAGAEWLKRDEELLGFCVGSKGTRGE